MGTNHLASGPSSYLQKKNLHGVADELPSNKPEPPRRAPKSLSMSHFQSQWTVRSSCRHPSRPQTIWNAACDLHGQATLKCNCSRPSNPSLECRRGIVARSGSSSFFLSSPCVRAERGSRLAEVASCLASWRCTSLAFSILSSTVSMPRRLPPKLPLRSLTARAHCRKLAATKYNLVQNPKVAITMPTAEESANFELRECIMTADYLTRLHINVTNRPWVIMTLRAMRTSRK